MLFHHHFDAADGRRVLAEMQRVAQRAVIVSDLRRSRLGGHLGRLVLALLRMGPITAVDGRLSLDQAWTRKQVRRSVPATAIVALRRRWPFRWVLELRGAGDPHLAASKLTAELAFTSAHRVRLEGGFCGCQGR